MSEMPLSKLSTVDWKALQHAYGSAEDIPEQLRELASPETSVRVAALEECYANIFHQGTRYSASAAAVPFIVGLLKQDEVQDKGELVRLLWHLAFGYQYSQLGKGFAFVNRKIAKGSAKSGAGQCRRNVEAASEVFFQLLDHPDEELKNEVVMLLACLRTDLKRLKGELARLITDGNSVTTTSTCAVALGVTNAGLKSSDDLDLLRSLMESSSPEIRLCAAIGSTYILQQDTDDNLCEQLYTMAENSRFDDIPWNDGDVTGLAGILLESLARLGKEKGMTGLMTLLARETDEDTLSILVDSVVYLLFENFDANSDELTTEQRDALGKLVSIDGIWHDGVCDAKPCEWAPECLQHIGLGETRDAIREHCLKQ